MRSLARAFAATGCQTHGKRSRETLMSDFAIPMSHATREREWRHHDVSVSEMPPSDSNSQRELDRRLDAALEDTFPASDPVSIMI